MKKGKPIKCPICGECLRGYILTDPKMRGTTRATLCPTHGVPKLKKEIIVEPITCPLDGHQGIEYEITDTDSGEVSKVTICSWQGIVL